MFDKASVALPLPSVFLQTGALGECSFAPFNQFLRGGVECSARCDGRDFPPAARHCYSLPRAILYIVDQFSG